MSSQRSSRSSTQQPATASDEPSLGDAIADLVSKKQSQQDDSPTSGTAGEPAPLPEGWVEKKDARTGKTYYYNKKTKNTQWKRPAADPSAAGQQQHPAGTPTQPTEISGADGSESGAFAPAAAAASARREVDQFAETAAFVSLSITEVEPGAPYSAAKATPAVPARIRALGPRLFVSTSIHAPVGFVDLASDVEGKMRCRVELMSDTIAVVVEESAAAAVAEQPQNQQEEAAQGNDAAAAAAQDAAQAQTVAPSRVTRKMFLFRPISSSVGEWVAHLRTAAGYSTHDGVETIADAEAVGPNIMKLEIAAALSGLFRRVPISDSNAAEVHFPFVRVNWLDAAKPEFDASFQQHVAAYHEEAMRMLQEQGSATQQLQGVLEQEREDHQKELTEVKAAAASAVQQQESLQQQVASLQHELLTQQQQQMPSHAAGAADPDALSSGTGTTSRPSRSASSPDDVVSRLLTQVTAEMVTFADAAQDAQTRFQLEARKMCNVLAQRVHQDELLMQSAPALGASAEEHIRHRRTLEEAFKSLQTLHGETSAELEVSRKRVFELKADLGAAQQHARESIEGERERSQTALRNVQVEASDHMKRLAANVDTLRADHAEELDRLRAAHEDAMAVLSKKLQIAEAKMLRAVEETEKTKFQLTQKSLEDHSKIAELKREKAASELSVSELRKLCMERAANQAEQADATARAVDRKTAAELARFKRLMIDRTLAGGGSISPGGTPHGGSSGGAAPVLSSPTLGGSQSGNTPRSAANIGVGDTSAGHELFNSFCAGGSVTVGSHTQRAMKETSEAVMMLSPRSNNNSPTPGTVPVEHDLAALSPGAASGAAAGTASVPRLNFAQAVRTPRDALGSYSARGAAPATGGSRYAADTPRSSVHYSSASARQQQQQQHGGGGGLFDNPNAQAAPVPESETYKKLADISTRLKDGLVALGAGSPGEVRRRAF